MAAGQNEDIPAVDAALPANDAPLPSSDASVSDYFSFVDLAAGRLHDELDDIDSGANRVILTLSRAASQIIYDLESSVHRPKGWSWSAFRLVFVIWLAGSMEPSRAAQLSGMSRAAVSNLANTLVARGILVRKAHSADQRAVTLELTAAGLAQIRDLFREHNHRETQWASALSPIEQGLLLMLLEKLMTKRDEMGAHTRN